MPCRQFDATANLFEYANCHWIRGVVLRLLASAVAAADRRAGNYHNYVWPLLRVRFLRISGRSLLLLAYSCADKVCNHRNCMVVLVGCGIIMEGVQ